MAGFSNDTWQPTRGAARRSAQVFADPFMDMSTLTPPKTMREALLWCQSIVTSSGPYREALRRIAAYFVTDIEVASHPSRRVGDEERRKYLDFFNDTLQIREVLSTAAMDFLTYGNSFISLYIPFRRYLFCQAEGCGYEAPLKQIANSPTAQFQWQDFEFHATCPKCGKRGTWGHNDRRSGDAKQLKVRRWNPMHMEILWDSESQDTAFLWNIPAEERTAVREGKIFKLERASWELIQAVKTGENLLLDQHVIYHMKEAPLAGFVDFAKGWGIARTLTNFRQAMYLQLMQANNEYIAMDHMLPMRVISPAPQSGAAGDVADPVMTMNMGGFVGRVRQMVNAHKLAGDDWHVAPYPLQYQAFGSEVNAYVTKDLLDYALQTMLNSIGMPTELFSGSLTLQAAPAMLRVFEAMWSSLVSHLNRMTNWLAEKVSQVMNWEPVTLRLARVQVSDDLNRAMAHLQLMMGGQISRTTGLAGVQLDFNDEIEKQLSEERIEAEAKERMQKEMEQAAQMDEMARPVDPASMVGGGATGEATGGQPGAAPPGAAPAAGAAGDVATQQALQGGVPGNLPVTMDEMTQTAENIAMQLMGLPQTQRNSQLVALKGKDEALHSLVTSKLDSMRQDAARQGQEMVLQQQFGKTAAVMAAAGRGVLSRQRAARWVSV